MSLFKRLFSKKEGSSEHRGMSKFDFAVSSASRHVEIINESLQLASKSKNPEVKLSRLQLAKDKLHDLKNLIAPYPEITLPTLIDVERDISRLEREFLTSNLSEIADGNMMGQQLEKEGKISEAIATYENLLEQGVDTPFTYRRLAILYRKAKSDDDEIRVLKASLANVPKSNAAHYRWLEERLLKKTT
jgi:tetratricopeptide (TPR) repeat protein